MSDPVLTVLYDGGCPLCSREISHYRRVAEDLAIRWVDITEPEASLAEFGVTRQQALAVFHVIDAAGTTHRGARAFLALWEELPRYRWLARACLALALTPLLEAAYSRFARWHFARRCHEGACGTGSPSP